MSSNVLVGLEVADYQSHWLHQPTARWFETNCYTDLWIELLHAMGLEPLACLGCTLSGDYEVDQWTFFKPSLTDIQQLYGITTEELTIWRDLSQHCEDHVQHGNIPLIEVDAYYLPDTAQTSYQKAHSKTTIAINGIDTGRRRLAYFHNGGYFELQGDDFAGLFDSHHQASENVLGPYCEFIKLDRKVQRDADDLRRLALPMARRAMQMRPLKNPIAEFGSTIDATMTRLVRGSEDLFQRWAFASLRQLGSASELAAAHIDWLAGENDDPLLMASAKFRANSELAKKLIMKCSRMCVTGRVGSLADYFVAMATNLDAAHATLERGIST